jgi:hypothetical protein
MEQKIRQCVECGRDSKIWSKGRCYSCSRPGYKKLTPKFRKAGKEAGGYKDFYASEIIKYEKHPFSVETGDFISNVGVVNIAHIFPKETYKSVSKNPDNIILLTWREHTKFDELLGKHRFEELESVFENSWSKICVTVVKLLPLLKEQGALSREFKKYLNID